MEQIARQLETVRFAARWMLVGQRVFQWLAVLIAVAMGLGLMDYALRLPGWLRLVIGVGVAVLAGVWIVGRLRAAWAFKPGLDELALRLERMYPQLSGRLATAVDFATHAELYRAPERTASLVAATLESARQHLPGVEVRRLLDPSRTVRLALGLVLAMLALVIVVVAAPAHSRIAFERWLMPLGSAQWPLRTQVSVGVVPQVWPADTPVRLSALVERGYQPGMRVAVEYRLIDASGDAGPLQSALMAEQSLAPGDDRRVFERQIELPEGLVRRLEASGGAAAMEFVFRAGDDVTPRQALRLVPRPAVTSVIATITPPGYAADFIEPQTVSLHEQSGQVASVSALRGSTVELAIRFNKPIPVGEVSRVLPEFGGEVAEASPGGRVGARGSGAVAAAEFTTAFVLRETLETPIRLVDEHGLTNLSERRYRVEAVADRPPTVSLVQPASDEAVLATAVVPVQAVAQDDVAVRNVRVEAIHERGGESQPPRSLVGVAGEDSDVRLDHRLDLADSPLGSLQPGDLVVLRGVTEDVFAFEGETHDPVRSSPRRLRIIDETDFISQLRTELGAVRQQAVRFEQTQRRLQDAEPATAAAGEQAELARRIEGQQRLVQDLAVRAERNRLDEPVLQETIERARSLLEQAGDAGRGAAQRLRDAEAAGDDEAARQDATEQARASQAQSRERLGELISLLDQGRDAFALELQLRQMHAQQLNLAEAARRLFPQTVGQDLESLPQELQDALRELGERQRAMGEQAREMVRQMQESAQNLAQQEDDDRARAAAEALAEAAATAQRRDLEGDMRQAGESIDQNQLSQAAQDQAQSLDTLQQMMQQMGQQQQRMMAMLRRRLQQLEQAIEELITRQAQLNTALDEQQDDARLVALESPQAALRRQTMVVEEQARQAEGGEQAAAKLGEAVTHQGQAVLALRVPDRMPAKQAQTDALSALEEALRLVRELQRQQADEEARQEREELKAAYEALAARQDEVREQTRPLADLARIERQHRPRVLELGQLEADIQNAAGELRPRVADTLVFQAMHDRLDRAADRAVRQLRSGSVEGVLADQATVGTLLRAMAAALDEDEQEEPFAGQQAQQNGGGGGEPPELIPPVAELRLLRAVQEAIYLETREVDEAGGAPRERLLELSARQRELSALGERLIEQVRPREGAAP